MPQNSVLIENDWSVRNDQTDLAARCSHNRFNQESIQKMAEPFADWWRSEPLGTNQRICEMHQYDWAANNKEGMGKNKIDREFRLRQRGENEDAEEEFLLQCGMEELNLDSESETESDDVIEINPEVVKEQKKQKQSQITDFFWSRK